MVGFCGRTKGARWLADRLGVWRFFGSIYVGRLKIAPKNQNLLLIFWITFEPPDSNLAKKYIFFRTI